MEYDIDEDNECPKCNYNSFAEYIQINPETGKGKYECSCEGCGFELEKEI